MAIFRLNVPKYPAVPYVAQQLLLPEIQLSLPLGTRILLKSLPPLWGRGGGSGGVLTQDCFETHSVERAVLGLTEIHLPCLLRLEAYITTFRQSSI